MSMGGSYYELDKPVVYGVHEGEIACAAVASGADTVLDLQTLFSRAWAQDYLTVYLDATPGAACTWALNNTGATVAAAGAIAARKAVRILSKGRRYLVLRMVSGTGTIRAWGSSVAPAGLAVPDTTIYSDVVGAVFDGAGDMLIPVIDSGVAMPEWTTGSVTAVAYKASHPTVKALGSGALITSCPPIDGTGATLVSNTGDTYDPAGLDGTHCVIHNGAANSGCTSPASAAVAPASYITGADKPLTMIGRAKADGIGGGTLSYHIAGFGNSARADDFCHFGGNSAAPPLKQFRKRASNAGGGLGPQVVTEDTTVHTTTVDTSGTVANMYSDGAATATGITQNEASTTPPYTIDQFCIGSFRRNGATPANQPMRWRGIVVANKQFNSADRAAGEAYVACDAYYSATATPTLLLIGSSTAAGFGLSAGQSYAELFATNQGFALTDIAINGLETHEALPTGTINPSWAPAVDTTHNITTGLAAVPAPTLAIVHILTDVTALNDYILAGMSLPGGNTWENYFDTVAVPNMMIVVNALIAAGAEVVVNLSQQPSDTPNPDTDGTPLATFTARRAYARSRGQAVFGKLFWDGPFRQIGDVDGTAVAGSLQGDNNHPTAASHVLFYNDLLTHVRERCPRAAVFTY